MKKVFLIIFTLGLMLASGGCVHRIVTIDSQPQGAQVYFDRQFIGETPCVYEFSYYGGHHLELVKEEYVNFNTTIKLNGPIYEYFPLSVISELFIPWQMTNKHSFNFKLEEGQTQKPIISPIKEPQTPLPAPRLERIETPPQ